MEHLERIANQEKPPLSVEQIKEFRSKIHSPSDVTDEVRSALAKMEAAFVKTGNLSFWSREVLDEIDAAFVRHYLDEDREPIPELYFPQSMKNLNQFELYCSDVDKALRRAQDGAPPFAREYFLYYSMWAMRGFKFPVPLGTVSVVGVMQNMLKRVKMGIQEVSENAQGDFATMQRA